MIGLGRWPAVLTMCCLIVACSGPDHSATETVRALWYGEQTDGQLLNGVTPVTIETRDDPGDAPFRVDLTSFESAGADEVWAASGWSAATVAMLSAGLDPRGWSVTYGLEENIGGPSAGGLLTSGVWAGLTGTPLDPDISMTGTILPNGAIGTVSGIPEKLRAAQSAGITTVLIPPGPDREYDPRTQQTVSIDTLARELGVEAERVATVAEAYALMTGGPKPAQAGGRVPDSPALVQLLERATIAAAARVGRERIAGTSVNSVGRRALVRRSRVAAAAARPGRDHVFASYAKVTQLEADIAMWNAAAAVRRVAENRGRVAARAFVTARIHAGRAAAEEAIEAAAATPLEYLEQYAALPDALTWGTGNLALLQVADSLVRPGAGTERLALAAAEAARAEYRIAHYLPIQLQAVQAIGSQPVTDPAATLSVLSAYAALLGEAGSANLRYAEAIPAGGLSDLLNRAEAQSGLWNQHANETSTDQPSVVRRLAVGLSHYVASTNVVMMAGRFSADTGDSDAVILDRGFFDDQIRLATTENLRQAQALSDLNLDASYVLWGNQWGLALASDTSGRNTTDLIRNRGLTYQWYANVQARMLFALA